MSSSYCPIHPASHRTLIDISDAWARPGTMCAHFASYEVPSMSRLHGCVDLSFDPSGRLMGIGLLAGCIFFTGVPGRMKYPVAPVSDIASCLDI